MQRESLWSGACPRCGSSDLLVEPSVDESGAPTSRLLVTCEVCGGALGELEPPAPAPEAEPERSGEGLLPGPEEAPRMPR